MISRNLRRALLDPRWHMPPTFLLPWAASLTTASRTPEPTIPPPPISRPPAEQADPSAARSNVISFSPSLDRTTDVSPPASSDKHIATPSGLSPSVRELLPLLKSQTPHYITIHIHGKPYLVTQGDTLRLPFLMHGVEPGDVLRLDRAVNIGSRDYTLKAAAAAPKLKSPTSDTKYILDPTTGTAATHSHVMSNDAAADPLSYVATSTKPQPAPHFVPHIEKGKHSYLNDKLFVCRAVVMGVESEPLRIKEKTKRRQRKVKMVRSKHRFTILRIKEFRIRDIDEIEAGEAE